MILVQVENRKVTLEKILDIKNTHKKGNLWVFLF